MRPQKTQDSRLETHDQRSEASHLSQYPAGRPDTSTSLDPGPLIGPVGWWCRIFDTGGFESTVRCAISDLPSVTDDDVRDHVAYYEFPSGFGHVSGMRSFHIGEDETATYRFYCGAYGPEEQMYPLATNAHLAAIFTPAP